MAAMTGNLNVLNPRQRLLQEAMHITSHDRNSSYGNPEDNFRHIAEFWSTYLTTAKKQRIVITPFEVAQMMVLMKTARLATNPTHRDSLVDQAGYSACAADCQESLLLNHAKSVGGVLGASAAAQQQSAPSFTDLRQQ